MNEFTRILKQELLKTSHVHQKKQNKNNITEDLNVRPLLLKDSE